jgi:hypothetical protein
VEEPPEEDTMTTSPAPEPLAVERVEDIPRMLKAMRTAVLKAVLRRKQLGNPVAVWREGRVVSLQPHEISLTPDEPTTGGS